MKKIFAVLLMLALLLSGCEGGPSEAEKGSDIQQSLEAEPEETEDEVAERNE